MNAPKKMTREEQQSAIADIHAIIAVRIVDANASALEQLFSGTRAVLVLDREARGILRNLQYLFPNRDDVEAVILDRDHVIVLAKIIDAKAAMHLAAIPPEEKELLPMFCVLFGIPSTTEIRPSDGSMTAAAQAAEASALSVPSAAPVTPAE